MDKAHEIAATINSIRAELQSKEFTCKEFVDVLKEKKVPYPGVLFSKIKTVGKIKVKKRGIYVISEDPIHFAIIEKALKEATILSQKYSGNYLKRKHEKETLANLTPEQNAINILKSFGTKYKLFIETITYEEI
jgi:hypothetical protein